MRFGFPLFAPIDFIEQLQTGSLKALRIEDLVSSVIFI
jgi:hypothetical protein